MRKDFFLQTGKYDEEMEIWGPDNVELSLRVRTCTHMTLNDVKINHNSVGAPIGPFRESGPGCM